jgi:hypothetical protein
MFPHAVSIGRVANRVDTTQKQASAEPGPESPTTARPLEMDDDDVQESGILNTDESVTKPAQPATANAPPSEEVPPPRPPRPVSEHQKNVMILKEAFPGIDEGVIKAVLTASGGRIDPAFNALLRSYFFKYLFLGLCVANVFSEMTDPDAVQEDEQPPPQPPRPVQAPVPAGSTPQDQLDADERYARQLAQHYENVEDYEARTSNRRYAPRTSSRQQPHTEDDREYSFMDDDLPAIRENLRKGFVETQTKVTSWFNDIKNKIEKEWNDDDGEGASSRNRSDFMGRPSRDGTRRSGDYDHRYDADPELLSDDFAGMKFNSDGS